MPRKLKDCDWSVDAGASGNYSNEQAQLSVLMDIRDELKAINKELKFHGVYLAVLHCHNFLRIPIGLQAIRRNTNRRKPKKS